MFVEAILIYIASLSGVFLHKYTKAEIDSNIKKITLLKTVLFWIVLFVFLAYNYTTFNFWIIPASMFVLFLINYLPQRIKWRLDSRSLIDMLIQNIPMGFAMSGNTAIFMFAYYIAESSLFSSSNKMKDSLSIAALSQIPFISAVLVNSYYQIPVSITAGFLVFLAIKKAVILKSVWNEKQ